MKDVIEKILQFYGIQLLLSIITITEFIISMLSFRKISKVQKAQVVYKDLIELDTILENIQKNTELINKLKNMFQNNLESGILQNIDAILALNYKSLGAVNKANEIVLNTGKKKIAKDSVYHESGYFNKAFFDKIILGANYNIVLYIKRNVRPFTLDNLTELINLADTKNVHISIFAFSSAMEDRIIEEMMPSIPKCPNTTNELKSTQEINKKLFLEVKATMKKPDNLNYYEYTNFPVSQYIIVDNILYWGIVNYNKCDMENVFDDRPYVEMSVSSKFAQYIISMQEKQKKECISKGNYF